MMTKPALTATSRVSPWLVIPRENPSARLRLFCFPYAGGNAWTFSKWPERLPAWVELCAFQLPGRGNRMHEKPFARLRPLVQAIATEIEPYLDKPFAFFGHSMGAVIAFEIARHLRRRYGLLPEHLFISGRRAPQLDQSDFNPDNLSEPEFLESLRDLNGTPKEVLEHRELMELMSVLLRADFAVCHSYSYLPEPALDCPVTVFGGLSDQEVSRQQLEAWQEQTKASFTIRMLPGDHFFLNSAQTTLLSLLSHDLNRVCSV
jgi:medium-chain acyl-[acyl-carrier-protein] hydrolase